MNIPLWIQNALLIVYVLFSIEQIVVFLVVLTHRTAKYNTLGVYKLFAWILVSVFLISYYIWN
jgi:hypothetical protein